MALRTFNNNPSLGGFGGGDNLPFHDDQGDAFCQILKELVDNAVDACRPRPGQGRVRVTLEKQANDLLRVTVTDNGCGMPDIAQCVNAFHTSKAVNGPQDDDNNDDDENSSSGIHDKTTHTSGRYGIGLTRTLIFDVCTLMISPPSLRPEPYPMVCHAPRSLPLARPATGAPHQNLHQVGYRSTRGVERHDMCCGYQTRRNPVFSRTVATQNGGRSEWHVSLSVGTCECRKRLKFVRIKIVHTSHCSLIFFFSFYFLHAQTGRTNSHPGVAAFGGILCPFPALSGPSLSAPSLGALSVQSTLVYSTRFYNVFSGINANGEQQACRRTRRQRH